MHKAFILALVVPGVWAWSAGCAAAPAGSAPVGSAAAATAAAATAAAAAVPDSARVRPGIEVLLTDSLHLLRGLRVGLVTNNAGVDASGVSDVARFRDAAVHLVALFSPEHGFRGVADPGAAVASSIDSATGLPIYSLYGRTSAPTAEMLEGIDAMIVDLQDVGARYYTYLSTTIDVMRGAAAKGIPVLVLDRPNPIGGAVQGAVLDTALASTVGRLAVPMRHGMTLGELALLAKSDLGLTASLTVIPADRWRRTMTFDRTGLPFVPPSPNLRTVESLFHYPGTCLFEGTNLSVGRGSDAPFEQIGAPWLDTAAVLAAVRAARLRGVKFRGVTFTPTRPGDGKYADTALMGIRLTVTDAARYDPTATAVHLISIIRNHHPDRFVWISSHFDRLAGVKSLRAALDNGTDPAEIVATWQPALASFRQRSKPYLLYPD